MKQRIVVGAHYGLRDWLGQRATAVLMALYTLLFLLVLVVLGVYIPKPLNDLIAEVAAGVEAR